MLEWQILWWILKIWLDGLVRKYIIIIVDWVWVMIIIWYEYIWLCLQLTDFLSYSLHNTWLLLVYTTVCEDYSPICGLLAPGHGLSSPLCRLLAPYMGYCHSFVSYWHLIWVIVTPLWVIDTLYGLLLPQCGLLTSADEVLLIDCPSTYDLRSSNMVVDDKWIVNDIVEEKGFWC